MIQKGVLKVFSIEKQEDTSHNFRVGFAIFPTGKKDVLISP